MFRQACTGYRILGVRNDPFGATNGVRTNEFRTERVSSHDVAGRTIYQVERVEVGIELAPDTFIFQSSVESGPTN